MNKYLKPIAILSALLLLCLIFIIITKDTFTGSEIYDSAPKTSDITQNSDTNKYFEVENTPETDDLIFATNETTSFNESINAKADISVISEAETEPSSEIPEAFDKKPEDTIFYKDDFFYHSLTDSIKEKITGISYPVAESAVPALSNNTINIIKDTETPAVSYDDLCYMSVLYYDFNGEVQTGELICNKKIANDLVEIFYELYLNEYPIEKIRLIDDYDGDDTASILDNNTSCFNYRVVDGTSNLSKHALGCAIDINPFYNPYVVFNKNNTGETYISPAGSEIYADRTQNFPYKIDEKDLCYKLFKQHGFTWGGNWKSCKDYQHFEKNINYVMLTNY